MLSVAGFAGQLVMHVRGGVMPYAAPDLSAITTEQPKLMLLLALVLFFLPIFASCYLALRHIRHTGRSEGLYIASLAFNTFSLLYGLILYGAFR